MYKNNVYVYVYFNVEHTSAVAFYSFALYPNLTFISTKYARLLL